MVLDAARIDRRDRGAVAVAEQDAAFEPDGIEHVGQHVARLLVHEGGPPRHHRGAGARHSRRANRRTRPARSPPRAGPENRPTGRPSRALHAAGRRSRLRAGAARSSGIRAGSPDLDEALAASFISFPSPRARHRAERCSHLPQNVDLIRDMLHGASARSLNRWILPVAVFGRVVRNSIQRGYLKVGKLAPAMLAQRLTFLARRRRWISAPQTPWA